MRTLFPYTTLFRSIGDDPDPSGAVSRLDDELGRQFIEWNGVRIAGEMIELRQYFGAESPFDIGADRGFVGNLLEFIAAFKQISMQNLFAERYGPKDPRKDAMGPAPLPYLHDGIGCHVLEEFFDSHWRLRVSGTRPTEMLSPSVHLVTAPTKHAPRKH